MLIQAVVYFLLAAALAASLLFVPFAAGVILGVVELAVFVLFPANRTSGWSAAKLLLALCALNQAAFFASAVIHGRVNETAWIGKNALVENLGLLLALSWVVVSIAGLCVFASKLRSL